MYFHKWEIIRFQIPFDVGIATPKLYQLYCLGSALMPQTDFHNISTEVGKNVIIFLESKRLINN